MSIFLKIAALVVFLVITWLIVHLSSKGNRVAGQIRGHNYHITFKNYPTIDLRENKSMMQNISIISHPSDNSYSVTSHLNGKELKEMLKNQYQLSDSDLIVDTLAYRFPTQ
ncbi:hypothetical protein BOVMAS18_01090 [Streptococcus uberis]|uniref:Exported protein n=2 Tax=Streptococcus uberis TaxID=1349 RepID=B9DRD1_STRU0|nr:hypothetical protein [Streptococcus uberis]KKF42531.1 hypothetical protein AF64_02220 [Streptococcus uberis C9359]KKF52557.1 hypothetical protein AF65_02290 [Streptococcus uberis C5388]KKF59545.1 hypothetical protein AF68_02570 [Streptococcus uberis B362]MCK1157362.1 hypothetical protein [Streptococcus uberis]MCK1190331.1 hypothetical protein [Streptococcus uberis]